MKENLRIFYTGTRPVARNPQSVEIYHVPMLAVDLLDLSHEKIRSIFSSGPVHYVFFSVNGVLAAASSGLFSGSLPLPMRSWTVGLKTAEILRRHIGDSQIIVSEEGDGESTLDLIRSTGPASAIYVAFELRDPPAPFESRLADPFRAVSFPAYVTRGRSIPDLASTLTALRPDWIVLTSPRGVDVFRENLSAASTARLLDHTHKPPARIAVLGRTTARHLESIGWAANHVAQRPDVEALIVELTGQGSGCGLSG
jgi:uroporphyrinogen-III synthase